MTVLQKDQLSWRLTALGVFLGVLWLVRLLDMFLPYGRSVAGWGIVPRTLDGLTAIFTAPLIHGSFAHLMANTLPLLVLGLLILLRGIPEFVFVTLVSAVSAGLGTWLFGSLGQHVGASGIVFGYLGFLLFRSAFDRKLSSALITLFVAAAYGGALAFAVLPVEGVSWSGHFFGFIGGFIAARLRYPSRRRELHLVGSAEG